MVSTEEPARPEAQHCQNPLNNLPPDPYRKKARALWQRQSHADNFTDGAFLSALVVNAQLTRRSYWQVLPITAGLGCSSKQSPGSIALLRGFTEPLTAEDHSLEHALFMHFSCKSPEPLLLRSRGCKLLCYNRLMASLQVVLGSKIVSQQIGTVVCVIAISLHLYQVACLSRTS